MVILQIPYNKQGFGAGARKIRIHGAGAGAGAGKFRTHGAGARFMKNKKI